MTDKQAKWQRQERALRATQMAFDLTTEVQKSLKKQAIDEELTPSDMIRKILDLEVKSKKTRQRLSFNLTDEEIALLAQRFGVDPDDKRAVKQQVASLLINRYTDAQGT
ncbi:MULTISPECIES: hypothetical protein [Pseudoalteromonas]|uniref:Uncharacterized protein n=2 Tax=Pseudoalteromonas TaxID=53246 RepID=A0A0L0EQD7_9GAMM|nr:MULTISPECIES: hypothetical protein [Pseudoalteromonas]MCG7562605.1 hypothetical protein [Pseudoalteromonas sp. McH1-42]ALU43310.1 hypothetical protein AT705_10365 [Pseudoalteromonas rubra]KAF7788396.1 hypothetical protein PRUB_a3048 [Pseudoalteromonas rubra]KNC66093.1 hypothetical protein AC626_19120 [Pseudoalteromonas rubra]MDK1312469.1 hypothetical protein [Pseudoalteromonas sp. R96]